MNGTLNEWQQNLLFHRLQQSRDCKRPVQHELLLCCRLRLQPISEYGSCLLSQLAEKPHLQTHFAVLAGDATDDHL